MSDISINDLKAFLEGVEDIKETNPIKDESVEVEDVLVPNTDITGEYAGDMSDECEEFCLQCIRMYVNSHIWHLTTDQYSEHEALEEYYHSLLDFTDTYIEAAIANEGGMSCETSYSLEMVPYCNMLDEIYSFKDTLVSHKAKISEDSQQNIIDDMITITDELLYKLKNLS